MASLSPPDVLENIAATHSISVSDSRFAQIMDESDKLRNVRKKFVYPKFETLPGGEYSSFCSLRNYVSYHNMFTFAVDLDLCSRDVECVYLCGNSLGLMPVETPTLVNLELKKYKTSILS